MVNIKKFFKKITALKWYYQLAIALISIVIVALLVKFLIWFVPIIGGILLLLFVFTEEEIFTMMWQNYKKSKQTPTNPLYINVYHWLTERGVTELPVSTMQFSQGVEFPDFNQGLYFVHLSNIIDDKKLADFEITVRQSVKIMSNGYTDCIISKARREPFLAIKIRLVPASEIILQQERVEEDF